MMKKLAFTLLTLVVFGAMAQEAPVLQEPVNGAQITFEESKFEFGDINQGDQVEHVFAFENTGNQPLVLSQVKTTCGCTVPSWPREPIAPGTKSSITVKFNSQGKVGMQNKVITIVSNAVNSTERIMITTNVLLPTQ